MTRKSNDKIKEELNISDAPIKNRAQSVSSDSGDNRYHHYTRRGHLAQDSEPVDDEAINEDLHNVIAAYWKDRLKPGFVGYKNNQEDEVEEVRVENDVDISFLKNPRWTIPIQEKEANLANEKKESFAEKTEESEDIAGDAKKIEEPEEEPEHSMESVEEEKQSEPIVEERLDSEEIIEVVQKDEATMDKPEEPEEPEEPSEIAIEEVESDVVEESVEAPEKFSEASGIIPEKAIRPAGEKTAVDYKTNTKSAARKKKKKKKKKKGPGRVLKWIFSILLLLVIGSTVTFGVMRYNGWRNSNRTNDSGEAISTPEGVISEDGGKTVVYKGVTYLYNEELSTILFIGVDKEKYEENGVSGEAGQADTVILTVVNQKTGETHMIPLSRSTMVAIDQYNTDGSYWKQDILQLAVSFAYGDNIDENCKNVAKAVSRILYGMPVHRYVTMDLAAIPQLNDAVGGVTVNCLEDMTDVDAAWTEGAEITLHGKQAEVYVRHRKTTISDETQDNNAPRMERQKQYLNSFIHTLLSRMKRDIFVPLRLYRDVGDDIYSDVTTSEIIYYTSMVVSKGFNNSILSIKGSVKHNEYTEFYPDEEELYQLILDTFYERQ